MSCTCKCGSIVMKIISKTDKSGNEHKGLYCTQCGKWQRWITANEERAIKFNNDITIDELKEALQKYIEKWRKEREITTDEKTKISLTGRIFLAQWIINSHKNSAIDITKILRNEEEIL